MKPGRTVGLSLAILASAMLFSILPLIQVALLLIVRARFQAVDLAIPGESNPSTPIAVGGNYVGGDNASLIVQAVLGAVFLVIAVGAWRGRPRWIGFVMIAAVLVLMVVTVAFSVAPLLATPTVKQGLDSGEVMRQVLFSGRLLTSVLVALYVVWYVNRGPARAFYRGYYLSEPE